MPYQGAVFVLPGHGALCMGTCPLDLYKAFAKETKAYKPIPIITDFTDKDGNDIMDEMVKENYINIKNEVKQIVSDELERISNDKNLCHLLSNKK